MDEYYIQKYKHNYKKFILNNLDKNWDFNYLVNNKIITLNDLPKKIIENMTSDYIFYKSYLLKKNYITNNLNINYVIKKKHYSWSWEYICANPSLNWETIQKYPNIFNNWTGLSYNSNLTYDKIEKNLNKKWNWKYISYNKMERGINNYVIKEIKIFIYLILLHSYHLDKFIIYYILEHLC